MRNEPLPARLPGLPPRLQGGVGATRRDAARGERASVLVLVPAMTLVLVCLGGIAIDLSLVHGAHRAAHRAVSAAADDAAAMLDEERLQTTGEVHIDPLRARRVALAQLERPGMPGRVVGTPSVRVDPDGTLVTVTAVFEIDHVLLRTLPGVDGAERLTVRSGARLNR